MRFDQHQSDVLSSQPLDGKPASGRHRRRKVLATRLARAGIAACSIGFTGLAADTRATAQQPWAPAPAAPANSSPASVTDVVLNSNAFHIPFNIAATGALPKEVQLFVAEIAPSGEQPQATSPPHRLASAQPGSEFSPESPSAGGKRWPAAGQTLGGWRLLDRQSPEAGQFYVKDVPDGAFWFAIRTLDGTGRSANEELIRPELRVIVDTVRPEVRVDADADAEGLVRANFSVQDATATKQVTAHYVTDTTRKWQVARVESTGTGGTIEFAPPDDWQQLSLRLRVVDQAGNETIVSELIKKPRVAAGSTRFASGPSFPPGSFFPNLAPATNAPGPYAPGVAPPAGSGPEMVPLPPPATPEQISNDFGQPGQPGQSGQPKQRAETSAESQPARPQTPAEAMRPLDRAGQPDELVHLNPASPNGSSESSTPASRSPAPPSENSTAPFGSSRSAGPTPAPASPQPETSFHSESIPAPAGRAESSPRQNAAVPNRAGAPNDLPLSGPQQASPQNTAPQKETAGAAGVPWESTEPTVRRRPAVAGALPNQTDLLNRLSQLAPVRFSDSLRFSLDYEIEAIGGRGVQDVELYGTTDGGETWTRWGQDPDRQTPFDIETLNEGTFGFRIVVVATNGLASPRPLPGDAPDIVVVVDETDPEAVITGAQYGEGDRTGSLVIQYRCSDTHLLPRPVTLAFGESIEGPWTTIAAGLRNMGDYVWPADPQLPRQIFLRLDVTDEAGNVGTYVLDQPIDTQGLAPRARIRAFRPISTRGGLNGSFVPDQD